MEIIDMARMMASRQLRFKHGEITLLEAPVSIIPIDFIVEIQKQLDKLNADNLVYYAAKDMGDRWFRGMHKHFRISMEDVIKWGINILAMAGWGETMMVDINTQKKFYIVRLKEGAESKFLGRSTKAVDHFVRGCYASGAKVIFGVDCDCVELSCVSTGSSMCEFIAKPTNTFNKKDPLVKQQLSIPKATKSLLASVF